MVWKIWFDDKSLSRWAVDYCTIFGEDDDKINIYITNTSNMELYYYRKIFIENHPSKSNLKIEKYYVTKGEQFMKPITPQEVIASQPSKVNDELIEFINKEILKNSYDWYVECVSVIIHTELSKKDKEKLEIMYKEAGWSKVKILNSSENGERPGLCQITLYW